MTWVKGTLKTIFILFICILVLTFVGEYFYLVLGLLVLAVILRQADKAKKKKFIRSGSSNLSKSSEGKFENYMKRTFATEEEADEDEWAEYLDEYSFEVVGESYNRDSILSIIRENNAIKDGELLVQAIMMKEPNNEFDDNAVVVFVKKKKVGYVSSDISYEVTNYLDERDLDGIRVKGKFGWDTTNPSPAFGLFLDFNF